MAGNHIEFVIAQSEVHQYNFPNSQEDIMKRFPYFVLFVLIFLLACGSIPGLNPTATPTLEPTLTPLPTKTPTRCQLQRVMYTKHGY